MKYLCMCLMLWCLFTANSKGQSNRTNLYLYEFHFESIFGTYKEAKENTYCLLGSGFFRAPRSANSDTLIADWMKRYPKAIVIPVSSSGPALVDHPNSKMIYCWVVSGHDTLNNYLIRNGCFAGGTMMRPRLFAEMKKWELDIYKQSGEKSEVSVFIDNNEYDNFIFQIKTAENYAREKKLGIWNKAPDEK